MSKPASEGVGEIRIERPIIKGDEDRLDRRAFVSRLADALIDRDRKRARGVVVGLVGPWGSGKSSVLNLLREELDTRSPRPVVVRFDPWLISGRDDLVVSLMAEIHAALDMDPALKKKAKRFLDAAAPYASVVAKGASIFLPGADGAVDSALDAVRARLGGLKGLLDRKAAVIDALARVSKPVVVLIDEIDRLPDDEIRTIAQLVRAVADFPHVSYVLAYDQQRVEEALSSGGIGDETTRRERGRRYLEKLVHMPLPLPILMPAELADLLDAQVRAVLDQNGVSPGLVETERAKQLRTLLVEGILTTPRDIHRVAGTFRVLLGMVGDEVNTLDTLGFAALHTKFPELADVVRRTPGSFAMTLTDTRSIKLHLALRRERDEELRWAARFGTTSVDPSSKPLLLFLWPDLDPDSLRGSGDIDNSVQDWRPLQTLLRLGLPPGTISGAETRVLLTSSRTEVKELLEQAVADGKILDLIQRASEAYPFLDHPAPEFWFGLAEWVRRPASDWTPELSAKRTVIDIVLGGTIGARNIISQRIRRVPADRGSLARLLSDLVEKRDPHIAPFWLQSHSLGSGLFGQPARDDLVVTQVISGEETLELLRQQASWAPSAFKNSELFLELHNGVILHQLVEIGAWDQACRDRLQQLVETPTGIDQFGLVFFGGGYITGRESLKPLLDVERLTERVKERLAELRAPDDARVPVQAALTKFLERGA
ncbi:P-loop NTPase fold protein [Elioraea sp.]|uniref:KAP family P-loop NTPase fold protein n=1 Tax=Elioraea sp. TaxID=2185103 RepID=UPI0025BB5795|nr:P-loop NTPase fold protein [Elioraea sp.]